MGQYGNINMGLRELRCEDGKSIWLTENRSQWRLLIPWYSYTHRQVVALKQHNISTEFVQLLMETISQLKSHQHVAFPNQARHGPQLPSKSATWKALPFKLAWSGPLNRPNVGDKRNSLWNRELPLREAKRWVINRTLLQGLLSVALAASHSGVKKLRRDCSLAPFLST
jgi:hypothetical protein